MIRELSEGASVATAAKSVASDVEDVKDTILPSHHQPELSKLKDTVRQLEVVSYLSRSREGVPNQVNWCFVDCVQAEVLCYQQHLMSLEGHSVGEPRPLPPNRAAKLIETRKSSDLNATTLQQLNAIVASVRGLSEQAAAHRLLDVSVDQGQENAVRNTSHSAGSFLHILIACVYVVRGRPGKAWRVTKRSQMTT